MTPQPRVITDVQRAGEAAEQHQGTKPDATPSLSGTGIALKIHSYF